MVEKVVVFCMLAMFLPTVASRGKTTCTASTVDKGESGNVTCHFSENLNYTRDAIAVHKLSDNNLAKGVLDCMWMTSHRVCYSAPGYEFDGEISSRLTLVIPSVTENEVGTYVCQKMGSNTNNLVPCMLTLKSKETTAQDDSSGQPTITVVGALVGIILGLAIMIPLLIVLRKRIKEKCTQETTNQRNSQILLVMKCDSSGASSDGPARKGTTAAKSTDAVRTPREKPCHVLILGPSGSGKSATCNTLLGDNLFQIGNEFATTTQKAEVNKAQDGLLQVMDTPDIRCYMTEEQQREELSTWKQFMSNAPHVIALVVRCGKAYTQEEYKTYQKIKDFWEDSTSFCQRLVVAFTFGDQLKSDIVEVLKTTRSQELLQVLRDASYRYVVFCNEGSRLEKENAVTELLNIAHNLGDEEDGSVDPYQMDDVQNSCDVVYSLLLMGKTANDRCVVGNTLLGIDDFRVTSAIEQAEVQRSGPLSTARKFKIVDIPDITDSHFTCAKQQTHMLKWKQLAAPGPDAILLTVKCDADYTAEEYDIYQQMKQLWGDSYAFCNLLVLAFVVGDQEGFDMENMLGSSMSSELKSVLEDAGGRSVVFKKQASADEKVQTAEKLAIIVQKLRRKSHPLFDPHNTGTKGDFGQLENWYD